MNLYIRRALGIALLSLSACSDSGTEGGTSDSRLEHDYLFIGGILSPAKGGTNEIFVGRLTPANQPDVPPAGSDKLLNRLLLTVRGDQLGEFTGFDDAIVHLSDDSGDSVRFTSVGNGFYRDPDTLFHVLPGRRYHLNVQHGSQSLYAETTIPGDFEFVNVHADDTIEVYRQRLPDPARSDSFWYWYPRWAPSSGTTFYRLLAEFADPERLWLCHSMAVDDSGIIFLFEENGGRPMGLEIDVEALDANYARLYRPERGYTGSEEWFSLLGKFDAMMLGERNSIYGGNRSVAGVFGSVNSQRVRLTVRPAD